MKVKAFLLSLGFLLVIIMNSISIKAQIKSIKINGYIGNRINTIIENRVKSQNVEELIEPFKHLTEGTRWQSEFMGKWMLGALSLYEYTQEPELYRIIERGADKLMKTQYPNGYIGNYKETDRLKQWDIWGRKYSALSLLAYYKISGDKKALNAVEKMIDHLIGELKQSNLDIANTGNYRGMASCSILEPVVYLYKETKKDCYLQFAKSIVSSIEKEGSSQLISKALKGIPVSKRFPFPKEWWSFENGHKAYEMMSCYEGLIELGKVLNDSFYIQIAEKVANNIIDEEINVAGSGAAFECWYGGKGKQTLPAYHTMETCVTFTWMQLCSRLIVGTDNSMFVDEFERTMYNALMASMKCDGSQISKYSPLEGRRQAGEEQCGMHINCCNANGPRAFGLIPKVAYLLKNKTVYVNLFLDSEVEISLKKNNNVKLKMETQYPLNGKVSLSVVPHKEEYFTIAIRIPSWLDNDYTITINSDAQEVLHKGGYLYISRKWFQEDLIELDFCLKTKLVTHDNCQAITHGPLVFARDSRFSDGDIDECSVIQCDEKGVINAKLFDTFNNSFAWITMEIPVVLGTDLENVENRTIRMIKLCDFGSAGNDWDKNGRYRVWLPQTIHAMSESYRQY